MPHVPISFKQKLAKFAERWAPRVIAELNDYQFKLVKVQGDFIWHDHKETDEAFIVLDGQVTIEIVPGIAPGRHHGRLPLRDAVEPAGQCLDGRADW